MIVGHGNIYITFAKKLIYSLVGFDCLSGPGEVIIIANETVNAHHIAIDLAL